MDWYALTDDILLHEPDRVVTRHRLDADDPFFRDHFPGRPVLPGVLATEALVQAGRVLLAGHVEQADRWVLASARAVRFTSFLSPGQWLVCEVKLLGVEDGLARLAATGRSCDTDEIEPVELGSLPTALSGRLELRVPRFGPTWNPQGP
ncbi:MAG: 3-hydroxyacyl-ACP dehydratase FabZ family protein [Phycisphaerales bacterium JB060]